MPKQPSNRKKMSLLREVLTKDKQSGPTRTTSATSPAASPAEEAPASAEAELLRILQRPSKYRIHIEEFVAASENPHDTKVKIEQCYKQFEKFTATRKGDCSDLQLESAVRPGTQNDRKWKLAKPCSLPPGHKEDEGNLRHRPRDYFDALQSIIDVGAMQETAPVAERQQKLIADLLDGAHSRLREKGVAWCAKISPVLPELVSILVAIEYREIKPESTRKKRVEDHYRSFFGCTLSPDDIMSYPGVKKESGEINADAIFRCLQEKRSEHLKSCKIEDSKGSYELRDQKEVTALIVSLALVYYRDAKLWPLWKELGKAMVAQFPSKTTLEVTSFVYL